jgi:hypothetical protein
VRDGYSRQHIARKIEKALGVTPVATYEAVDFLVLVGHRSAQKAGCICLFLPLDRHARVTGEASMGGRDRILYHSHYSIILHFMQHYSDKMNS